MEGETQDPNQESDEFGALTNEALPDGDIPSDYTEIAYRHKAIAHFQVGEFEFVNHIMVIRGPRDSVEAAVNRFKELYRGLHNSDKIAIVKLRNVQNEEAVDRVQTIRGPVGTNQIADREIGGQGGERLKTVGAPVAPPAPKPLFLRNGGGR